MSATVSRFLWEDVITRHNVLNKLICDEESENKMWVKMLTELYEIDQIVVSAYNSEANDMMKREHKPLIDALSKMTAEGLDKWSDLLTLVLWANQTSIRRSTDWTPYEILYEYACICHSFFWTQLLTVILLSHTWSLLTYFSETHIASLNTIDLSNLNCSSLLHHEHCYVMTSNSHTTSLLHERNF